MFVFNSSYIGKIGQQQRTKKFLGRGKRKQWQNLRNPTEVAKKRTGTCSQKRSVPREAKHKSKADAPKLLEEKN